MKRRPWDPLGGCGQGTVKSNRSDRAKMKWTTGQAASAVLRYGLASASVAAALGLASAFVYFHLPQTFGTFALSAIAVTFWYAGTKPGILAALLSSVVRDFLFDAQTNG